MTVGWMNKLLISLQTVSERQQSHEILMICIPPFKAVFPN